MGFYEGIGHRAEGFFLLVVLVFIMLVFVFLVMIFIFVLLFVVMLFRFFEGLEAA